MSAVQASSPAASAAPRHTGHRSAPRRGWTIVAAKEFSDHIQSVRFFVLLIVLFLAAGVPIFLASQQIRSLASQASGSQAVFIALFWIGPQNVSIVSTNITVASFVALVAPLLGIAFSFDAVNGERAQGTLPRLVSQPIHRDDVINGKFAAALGVITFVLVSVLLVISGFGMWRLGIVPAWSEIIRLVLWLLVTILYVALWLAFGLLLSVVIRRAASSALVGFGLWMLLTLFGSFIAELVLGIVAPIATASSLDQAVATASLHTFVLRLLPSTLYGEVSSVLLNPSTTTTTTPATVGQLQQAQQQIPSLLSLDQSILLVWPQVVALIALTVICFALAYVRFMREEVRA